MNEITFRNESLGLSMTKVKINGIDVVWAENIRKALKWDSVPHMVRGLKEGKEVLKIRISDLESSFSGLLPNLAITSEKGGRPQEYTYFLTRQGVARLIATRRPHDIKNNRKLADWLDRLQDWIFGEVLPEVLTTGRYSFKPLVAGQHAVTCTPRNYSESLRMLADEYDAHEQTINALVETKKEKAWISEKREAKAMQTAAALTRKINTLEREKQEMIDAYDDEIDDLKDRLTIEENDANRYRNWRSKVGRPRKGGRMDDSMYLF